MTLRPDRLPTVLRVAAYGVAVAVLLYLTQAPTQDLPRESLWDKAEHGLAWLVLAGIGLTFWPQRPGRIAAFAFGFGGLVEVLQSTLPFGRDGDARDLIADSVGILAALVIWAVLRRLAGGRPLRA
ncbi:hypothetical protein LJR225_003392 [Phenylobacterium sp. LjRoot225]|uniref:VanZ family protein n=1 Tax=Phenylobacterium sp. LjRoot225 TaxID=3342285 RepID=UPI003ECCFE40